MCCFELCNIPVFDIISKDDCCGCEACLNSCPLFIIEMKEDEEGFRFPAIDTERCVHCRKCEQVCPVVNGTSRKTMQKAFAGYSKNPDNVVKSSSGGYFSVLGEKFLSLHSKGVVCAVVWEDDFEYVYHMIGRLESLDKMRGSKYIHSRKGTVYQTIKKYLNKGEYVMFVGCGCENAALHTFLGKEYENLLLVDLVCKGVTSERVLRDFIQPIMSKKKKISNINMRYVGWKKWIPQWIKIDYSDGRSRKKIFYTTDIGRGFYLMQRKSCYGCTFSGDNRYSDITLGDYHGTNSNANYYNALGTSVLVANSEKGLSFVQNINEEKWCLLEVEYDDIAAHNPYIQSPSSPNPVRDKFSMLLQREGLRSAVKKTYPPKEHFINMLPPGISKRLYNLVQFFKK